jgi:hypothetical protein
MPACDDDDDDDDDDDFMPEKSSAPRVSSGSAQHSLRGRLLFGIIAFSILLVD